MINRSSEVLISPSLRNTIYDSIITNIADIILGRARRCSGNAMITGTNDVIKIRYSDLPRFEGSYMRAEIAPMNEPAVKARAAPRNTGRHGWLAAEDENDEHCGEDIRAYPCEADPEGVVQGDVHVLARIAFRPVKLIEHIRGEGEGDEAHAEDGDEHARQELNRAEGKHNMNTPSRGCKLDGEDVDEHGKGDADNRDAERGELS